MGQETTKAAMKTTFLLMIVISLTKDHLSGAEMAGPVD